MPKTTPEFSNGYALFIGVGNYLYEDKLPVTANDATVLYKLFTNPDRAGYPAGQVKLLVNEEASKEGILAGLDWLLEISSKKPGATVVIYYSGHGGRANDGSYILVPFEFNLVNWEKLSISKEVFADKVNKIGANAKKLLVILDCCHASGITAKGGFQSRFFSPSDELFLELKQGVGRVVVASSRASEYSYILKNAVYSAFTGALIDALDRTADNGDGYASILRALPVISDETKRISGYKQTPVFDLHGVEDFVICRVNKQLSSKQPFRDTFEYGSPYFPGELPEKSAIILTPNIPAKPIFFLGRQKQLKDIHKKLTSDSVRQNIWLLNGVGGMGKTTIMREYLHSSECRSAFDRIAFAAVDKNLESAFVAAGSQALGLEEEITAFRDLKDKLQFVAGEMRKLQGLNLFIIDNINERDFEDLIKMKSSFVNTGWKFLITTRTIPDGFASIYVDELSMEDAELLFTYHYANTRLDLTDENGREEKLRNLISDKHIKTALQSLLTHIVRHTLLTELLAKTALKQMLSLEALLCILREQDYKNPALDRVIIIEDHATSTFREQLNSSTLHLYLLSLFETEFLVTKTGDELTDHENEAKATMLRFFSVLPPSDISIGDLKALWRVETVKEKPFEERLDELRQIGWIQGGQPVALTDIWYQNLAYKMHPLVQDVVYEKLAPNIDNCRPLVKTITEALNNPGKYSHIYKTYAKSVIDNLNILKKKFYGVR